MAKVSEYKKKLVEDMTKLMRQHPIIGVVNMENLPAPQLQSMRAELRGKVNLFMTKKRLMKIALEKVKNEKKHIEELKKYFEGMPALIFTNESPFKLSRILQKSKTSAPAKAGQIAPNDITVKKGPTPFAPGPVISELSSAGLKVGVEAGKVAIKEDTVVAKKGDKIKPKVAEILTRLGIKPMQVGLGLVAAYENGIIYQKDILEVDEAAFNEKVNLAATQAFNLAFNIAYTTKDNIKLLIAKAFNDAKALGIGQEIFDKGIIEELLSKAENSMLSIKTKANIEVVEKLEEEKEILKEEKKLEEKPKQAPTPQEKEVQEAVKEEEEKQLERERIEKEKEVEKAEKEEAKPQVKEEAKKEPEKPKDEVDKKVEAMVKRTKKFVEGKEETAAEIVEEVKEEEEKEKKKEKPKEEKPKVPTTHDLKEQKEKKDDKEEKKRKEVEDLTKELLKKGTLRKK